MSKIQIKNKLLSYSIKNLDNKLFKGINQKYKNIFLRYSFMLIIFFIFQLNKTILLLKKITIFILFQISKIFFQKINVNYNLFILTVNTQNYQIINACISTFMYSLIALFIFTQEINFKQSIKLVIKATIFILIFNILRIFILIIININYGNNVFNLIHNLFYNFLTSIFIFLIIYYLFKKENINFSIPLKDDLIYLLKKK